MAYYKAMATIKEVAAAAGVSVGTVSNVLNGYEHVKEVKRNQVLAAIDALGYKPNSIARTLKTKISKTVGLIVPDISNPFYAEIARGTEDVLRQSAYNLFLCSKDRNSGREADYADALMDKNVDGIIIIKPTINEKKIRSIGKTSKLILIDTYLPVNGNYAVINVDDEQSACKMTEYLYRMGHRTITYFSGNTDARSDKLRFQGYKCFMKKVNLYNSDHVIKCGIYRTSESYRRAFELFKTGRIPDAVFAANDILALGVIQAAFDSGLTVPGDISVVGCDDIEIASYFRPALTTICRPKYNLGSAAAGILIDSLVHGKPIQSLSLTLAAELVIRNSVFKKTRRPAY
jgi:LacI family transcriptional regulator